MATRRIPASQITRQVSRLTGSRELSSGTKISPATAKGPGFSTAAAPKAEASPPPVWATPFTEPLQGFAAEQDGVFKSHASDPFATEITTLPSGLRVATEPGVGDFATVGLFVEAGSRHAVAYPAGLVHLLEKLAFMSTQAYPSREELFAKLESSSAICDALGQRHSFALASTCHVDGVSDVLSVIADSALRPRMTDAELEDAKQLIRFELENQENNPDKAAVLQDLIHRVAFRGNTLGLAKICPEDNVNCISRPMLFAFLSQHFVPERMVVGGVGVEHSALVAAASAHFEGRPPVWTSDYTGTLGGFPVPELDTSVAQYTGGELKVEADLSVFDFGPSPFPNLAHLSVGLQGASFLSDDYVPLAVLQSLFGGGDSFSAGGPGKGLYTRLYTQVLNRHHYLYSCQAFNTSYKDAGLFYIQASCPPQKLGDAARVVTSQLLQLAKPPSDSELDRAKNQLKASLMMNLETRPARFEDMVEMVLGRGYRKTPKEFLEDIDAVTPQRIQEVCGRMLASKPSLVGYGDVGLLPPLAAVEEALAEGSLKPLDAAAKEARRPKGILERLRGSK